MPNKAPASRELLIVWRIRGSGFGEQRSCDGSGGRGSGEALLFVITGDGAHAAPIDNLSLHGYLTWGRVEVAVWDLGITPRLEAFLRAQLGAHNAPISPVVKTIISLLSYRWRGAAHLPTHVLGHSIGEAAAAYAAMFNLIGASFGASLALHVARAARAIGVCPRRLVLADPPPAVPSELPLPKVLTRYARCDVCE